LTASLKQFEEAGQSYRTRAPGQIDLLTYQGFDLEQGRASIEVCALGNAEIVDTETGDVIAFDTGEAFLGVVTIATTPAGEWKVADYFTTQPSDNPQLCDIEVAS
jgi:hypothetical protein